jgi:hypothetical protein
MTSLLLVSRRITAGRVYLGDKDSAAKYNAIRSARNQSVSKFRSGRFRAITYRRLIDAYAASQEHQWHR